MNDDPDLVGNFVDLFERIGPKEALSVLGRFMDLCKANKLDASIIGRFMDLCEARDLDPAEALRELNAQDWDADNEDMGGPTEEQLAEMNRLGAQIVGEPTADQMSEIFRSVMTGETPTLAV